MKLNRLILIGVLLIPSAYAETGVNDTPVGESASPAWQLSSHPLGENTETTASARRNIHFMGAG